MQKTAYEMRISDWSSDVCSSDLQIEAFRVEPVERIIAGGGLPGDAEGIEAPHLALGGAGASSDAGVLALGVAADHRAVDDQQVGNDGAHTLAAARGGHGKEMGGAVIAKTLAGTEGTTNQKNQHVGS